MNTMPIVKKTSSIVTLTRDGIKYTLGVDTRKRRITLSTVIRKNGRKQKILVWQSMDTMLDEIEKIAGENDIGWSKK